MSILSLCSGYGGLELATQAAFGPQTIDAVCDNYKPARQVLAHHHPDVDIHNNGNDHGRSLYQMCHEGTHLVMEHLMALPTGYITNQDISDAAKRRLLGNGVAPQQGHLSIYRAWKQHTERNS
jgi:hypothetical protein